MKFFILFTLFYSAINLNAATKGNTSSAELEQLYREADSKAKKKYLAIARLLYKDYVTPIKEKILPKLDKDLLLAKKKIKRAKTVKTKKRYLEDIKKIEDMIELNENWITYLKAYMIYNKAYFEKDDKKYKDAKTLCKKIEARYKEITGNKFPYLYAKYLKKYGPIK